MPPARALTPPPLACMVALLILFLCTPRTGAAEESSASDRWGAVRTTAIERLHELATWCNSKRLYAGRSTAHELILGFDPDDATARKRLRYRRGRDGQWTRTPRHKPPRNLGSGKKLFEQKLADWRTWLLEEARPLLEEAAASGDAALRCEILGAAIPAVPDDPTLRQANGEVEHTWNGQARWVLAESQVAKERRSELQRIGADAAQEVPDPRVEEPRADERLEAVEWGSVLAGRHVRILGTASPPEMDLQYTHCEAVWPVLCAALGLDDKARADATPEQPLTVYVTKSVEVGNRFLRALPDLPAASLESLVKANTGRIPERQAVLVKDGSRPWRLEAGAKELVAVGIQRVLGVEDADAWLGEGLAHYVTYLITGTQDVYRTGEPTETGAAEWLASPDALVNLSATDDWLGAGHDLCTSASRPHLRTLATKDLRTITPDEVLLGYCLTAYLLEGRPDACTAFFRAVGRTPPGELEAVALEHLGLDLPTLEARLTRWLAETTGRIDRE